VIAIDYSLSPAEQLSSGPLPVEKKSEKTRKSLAKSTMSVPSGPKVENPTRGNGGSSPAVSGHKASASGRKSPSVEKILAEVKRAVAELSEGKSVPAYERLKRILDAAR